MAKRQILLEKGMMATAPRAEPQQPTADEPRRVKDYGEPLNFRVPAEFGAQFRMVALRRKMKLQQLLQKCFEVYMREEGGNT